MGVSTSCDAVRSEHSDWLFVLCGLSSAVGIVIDINLQTRIRAIGKEKEEF